MKPSVEIIQRLFRAVEERDIEPMFEIYDPEVVIREAQSLPYGGEYRGHKGVVEHGLGYVKAWDPVQSDEDREMEAEFISAGDRVFVRWRQKAHAGDGSRLDLPAISMYRLREGRVVESAMHHLDTAALVDFLEGARDS